jgi:anti-sigma B factor antagonist
VDSKILVDQWGDSVLLVVLSGEHDLTTASELGGALASVTEQGGDVIIDLSETTFADSSTLQEILRYATQPGGSFAIVAAPGTEPRRLLERSAVDQLLPVRDTRDEALRQFGR